MFTLTPGAGAADSWHENNFSTEWSRPKIQFCTVVVGKPNNIHVHEGVREVPGLDTLVNYE